MRFLHHHRRTTIWLVSSVSAIVIAVAASTAVLAEAPACVVNGEPVAPEAAAANPELCGNTSGGGSSDETGGGAVEPTPEPPTDPTPPPPTDPAPNPETDGGSTETGGGGTESGGETSTDDGGGTTTDPTTTKPTTSKPLNARPSTTRPARTSRRARRAADNPDRDASQNNPDARGFREQFTPTGRIPEPPRLSKSHARAFMRSARATDSSWAVLAAISFIDSSWGDPVAGGLVGQRLSDRTWRRNATDGDGDGVAKRSSEADQVATVAKFVSSRPTRRAGLRAYFGARNTKIIEKAELYADLYAALGVPALTKGLNDESVHEWLADRVLADDERIEIYDAGRSDIEAGIIDPRLLVTMRFLRNRFDSVRITSLVSGHGVFTTSGNISLHSYGQAMDIGALDGETVTGNMHRGSNTYHAVRGILLLPESMQPAELISLWDMGGPSFAMADHADHIHIGFQRSHDHG